MPVSFLNVVQNQSTDSYFATATPLRSRHLLGGMPMSLSQAKATAFLTTMLFTSDFDGTAWAPVLTKKE
jgi:hypothetical protein